MPKKDKIQPELKRLRAKTNRARKRLKREYTSELPTYYREVLQPQLNTAAEEGFGHFELSLKNLMGWQVDLIFEYLEELELGPEEIDHCGDGDTGEWEKSNWSIWLCWQDD